MSDRGILIRSQADLSKALKIIRKSRKLTLKAAGARTFMNQQSVWVMEQGKVSSRVASVIRHLNALGYDLVLMPREERADG